MSERAAEHCEQSTVPGKMDCLGGSMFALDTQRQITQRQALTKSELHKTSLKQNPVLFVLSSWPSK